jgi:hypothetical protein
MSNARLGFDTIGVVVGWIEACRQRRLEALLDLYDDAATVECYEGGSFRGRSAMKWYWTQKLANAFEIDALVPENDGSVSLYYRDHDGQHATTHFQFTDTGKIRLTACSPIKEAVWVSAFPV